MNGPSARYAYAQARLGARIGARPRQAEWARLAVIADAASFVEAARRTSMARLLGDVTLEQPIHAIEATFRAHWRAEVESVAKWYPAQDREMVLWLAALPLLPAISHLIAGRAALPWMANDAELAPFLDRSQEGLAGHLERAKLEAFLPALSGEKSFTACWVDHWRSLWPDPPGALVAFLAQVTEGEGNDIRPAPILTDWERANQFFLRMFRRYQQTIVSALAYLGLVALDLQRLRGEIAVRKLLPQPRQEVEAA